jgi:hypothetical protein
VSTPRRPAFTLLEVLLAIVLGIALIGALFAFYWDLLAARERLLAGVERSRAVATLFEGLERDLLTAVAGDDRTGAGVSGGAASIEITCRAVAVRRAGESPRAAFSDLERSAYRFAGGEITVARAVVSEEGAPATESDPDAGASEGAATEEADTEGAATEEADTEEADTEGAATEEAAAADAAPAAPAAFAVTAPLGGSIAKVRFRYHDGEAWRDDFDSLALNRLPVAVEVAVWFELPDELRESAQPPADEQASLDGAIAPRADFGAPDEESLPPPDRVRVIAIPGSAEPDSDEPSAAGDAP